MKNSFYKIKKNIPEWVKTITTILILIITTIFLTKTLLSYYDQIQHIIYSISPLRILLSLFFFLAYLYFRALSWKSLIHFLGGSLNKTNSLYIWFFSEATRYIPGNVWSFVSRSYLAQQKKVSRSISILVLPLEAVIVITTTSILSLYSITENLNRFYTSSIFDIVLILSLLITLVLLVLHKPISRILNKLVNERLFPKQIITTLIFQFLSWSLYSIGYLILITDFTNIHDPTLLFSSTLLAWLIGYLSIVTPMGLGIRESAFVLLTGPQIGIPQAALIAVLARIIFICSELINLFIWVSMRKKHLFSLHVL